jgi:hypothetical protein
MRLPRHRWLDLQSLMNAYEIVVHEVDNGHAQSRRVRSQEGMEAPYTAISNQSVGEKVH